MIPLSIFLLIFCKFFAKNSKIANMDRETRLFKAIVKKYGHSFTKPRRQMFQILQEKDSLTIPQLISLLSRHDQATVYRNIKLFEQLGIINRLRLGWKSKLELSDVFKHHHHHFSCVNCGKITILKENPVIELEIIKLTKRRDFKAMDHQLEIRGLCPNCKM